jgi:hypothetical protein
MAVCLSKECSPWLKPVACSTVRFLILFVPRCLPIEPAYLPHRFSRQRPKIKTPVFNLAERILAGIVVEKVCQGAIPINELDTGRSLLGEEVEKIAGSTDGQSRTGR